MITGIHHIALLLSSKECLDFYKRLGFVETFRKDRANDKVILLEGHGMQLEVFIDNRHPARNLDFTEPLGPRHFALKVDNLEKTLNELSLKHTDIDADWQGNRYCYIVDFDNNQVELCECREK